MVETFGKSWFKLICQVDLVALLTDGIVAHILIMPAQLGIQI